MNTLTITAPDDLHCHFRDDEALLTTVPATARQFSRAIVMPNLKPPVVNTEMALAYRQRILAALPDKYSFTPLMTLYLTDDMSVDDIKVAAQSAHVYACKLYPAGATTNSAAGVTDITKIFPLLEAMQDADMPLLIHGEVTSDKVDIFDRERVFIDTTFSQLREKFPALRMVLEHLTTAYGVEYIRQSTAKTGATITAHHLLINRNHMLVGGIKPHFYCLPVAKRLSDQEALLMAATSGDPHFFLGTDSAPHAIAQKESACGCAGIYSAPVALESYAMAFDTVGKINQLEGFASHFGADFYQIPRNTSQVSLIKEAWDVPQQLPFCETHISPFFAGQTLNWRLQA